MKTAEMRALARLAAPIVGTQVGFVMLSFVDTVMVGRLGGDALAAVALVGLFSWGVTALGTGLLAAMIPKVAQAWGAGDRALVGESLKRGLLLSLVIAIPYMFLYQYAEPILIALGQPAGVVRAAADYVHALVPGMPAMFAFFGLRQSLQAMGVVRPALIAALVGNVVNVVANYAFIFGHWGAPALGVAGSGWSTTCARYVMLGVLVLAGAPAWRAAWKASAGRPVLKLAPFLELFRIGVPIGLQEAVEVGAFQLVGVMVGWLGAVPLAGHHVALSLVSLTTMVPMAIGQAAAVRVGHALGRQDPGGAGVAASTALIVTTGALAIVGATFLLVPVPLVRIFTHEADVIRAATLLLEIGALFQVFDALQLVGSGILRGAADTRVPAIASLTGYWLIGIPISVLCGLRLHWGAAGVWAGLVCGSAAVAAAVLFRVWRRHRLR